MDLNRTGDWKEHWRGLPKPLRRVLVLYAAVGVLLWPVPLLNVLHVETCALLAALSFFAAGLSSLRLFAGGMSVGGTLRLQEGALSVFLATHTISLLWAPNLGYPQGLLFFLLFPAVTVVLAVGLAYALSGGRIKRKSLVLILAGVVVAALGPVYDLGFHPQFYTYNHVFGGVLGPIYDQELAIRPGLFAFRGLTLLWALFFFLAGTWSRRRDGPNRGGPATESVQEARQAIARRAAPKVPSWTGGDLGVMDENYSQALDNKTIKRQIESTTPGPSCPGGESESLIPALRCGTRHPCTLNRTSSSPTLLMACVAATAILIGSCYLFAGRLGINTTPETISRALGGVHRTAHFSIHYDPEAVPLEEIERVALDHEYHYQRLAGLLDVQVEERIASYLYPDAETKARLTGARYTNVAPVWLPQPQVHVLMPAYAGVFPHELAHVFSREFGLPFLRATLSVGLVEGLAVALEPPDGLPTPDEQVISAALMRAGPVEEPGLAGRLSTRLSPAGFWTGRGAVSYATMGSFVGYLLEAYGAEPFKQVYAYGAYREVYGTPVDTLAAEWERHLLRLPTVPSAAGAFVSYRFSIPSLFEVESPHYVPPYVRQYRRAVKALAQGDTASALAELEGVLGEVPGNVQALLSWGQVMLARGAPGRVARRLVPHIRKDSIWSADLLAADAFAALGRPADALRHYARALAALPPWLHEWRALLLLKRAMAVDYRAARLLYTGPVPGEGFLKDADSSFTSGAAGMVLALQLGAARRYPEAAALLSGISTEDLAAIPVPERLLLERQRLDWLSRYRYRAGWYREAAAAAREAAGLWSDVGGFNEAARLLSQADEYQWTAGRLEAEAGNK